MHIQDLFKRALLLGFSPEKKAFRAELVGGNVSVKVSSGGSLEGEFRSTNVLVGKTPVPLPEEVLKKRQILLVYNNSGRTVYIGDVSVSVESGTPLKRDKFFPQLDVSEDVPVYAVADKGENDLRVIEGS